MPKRDELAAWVPVGPAAPGASQTAVLETASLTIANGGTESTAVEIGNPTELGLIIPTITAATMTVQVSNDNVTYYPVVGPTGTATLVIASGTGAIAIDSASMRGVLPYRYLRVVSGGAQGAARTLIVCRKITRTDPLV